VGPAEGLAMTFERKITLGDLLTFVSIALAAAGLAWTWHQDILTRQREQATEVRRAAAATLAKMERLGQLTDLLFADLQPTIVETGDLLAEKHDAGLARDYFWKTVAAARLGQRKRIMDEQIESAYVALYTYMTDARTMFQSTVGKLQSSEDKALDGIMAGCQNEILAYDRSNYQPANLGNRCRGIVEWQRQSYFAGATEILAPVERRLEGIVSAPDSAIISGLNAKTL
jgi:hypothetical protein